MTLTTDWLKFRGIRVLPPRPRWIETLLIPSCWITKALRLRPC